MALNRWNKDFSERDRARLSFLSPHITQAYKNAQIIADATENLDGIGEGLDSIHRAALLARPDGTIRWLSPLARLWLDEFFPECHPRKLPAELENWIKQHAAIAGPVSSHFSELQLGARGGCRLLVYCGRTDSGEFLMALIREHMCIPSATARLFGLTVREAEILFWISEAKTNPESPPFSV